MRLSELPRNFEDSDYAHWIMDLHNLKEGTPTTYAGSVDQELGPMLVAWIDATTGAAGEVIGEDEDDEDGEDDEDDEGADDDDDDDEDDDDDDEEGRDTTITSRGRGFPSVKKMFAALNNVWLTEFKMESPCWFNLAHDKYKKL